MAYQPVARRTITICDSSYGIAKSKPKIKVVHIFAPEIIKTDAANFRELVQRLTGQPTKRIRTRKISKQLHTIIHEELSPEFAKEIDQVVGMSSVRQGLISCHQEALHKEEEKNEFMVESNCGVFLPELEEFDGFFQELSDLPFPPLSSSRMDAIGESS